MPVSLASTQSVVCGQCKAVVDLSKGVGGELAHYAQENVGAEPQIPLGTSGTFAFGEAEARWQLVGYLERCDLPAVLKLRALADPRGVFLNAWNRELFALPKSPARLGA